VGNRANIFVQQVRNDEGKWDGIGVYSHWNGTRLHDVALEFLDKAKARAGDPSYFTRILVHNVLDELANRNEETGFGLWSSALGMDDNEHDILVINAESGRYWYTGHAGWADPEPTPTPELTAAESAYVGLPQ
jgi:hypothetical protein